MKIYVLVNNRPDFIYPQYESLKRFCRNRFSLIILNNASNVLSRYKIRRACKILKLPCVEVPFDKYPNANIACGSPLQWAYERLIYPSCGINVVLDSDMFLINPINFEEYVNGYEIAGVSQVRGDVKYPWNGILVFNNPRSPELINLLPGNINSNPVDVGGLLYYWMTKIKPRIRYIKHSSHIKQDNSNLAELPISILKEYQDEFNFEIYDRIFLHYSRGSNWKREGYSYHRQKSKLLQKFVNGRISGKVVFN